MNKFFTSKKDSLFIGSLLLLTGLFILIHQSNQLGYDHQSIQTDNPHNNDLSNQPIKVLTPAWSIGATLTQLGNPPIGIGNKSNYAVWVVTPPLPPQVADIGLRAVPNPEMVADLHPDLIMDNPWYEIARKIYDPNTPKESINFGRELDDNGNLKPREWSKLADSVNHIGKLIERPERATQYIKDSKQQIEANGAIIESHLGKNRKIVVTNFYSVQQINSFGTNSILQLSSDMMGLDLVSIGTLNTYGFSSVPLHRIHEIPHDACLIIMEPITPFLKYQLKNNLIWQRSQYSKPDACMYVIKPVWNYGGINVMLQFSNNLTEEITHPKRNSLVRQSSNNSKNRPNSSLSNIPSNILSDAKAKVEL